MQPQQNASPASPASPALEKFISHLVLINSETSIIQAYRFYAETRNDFRDEWNLETLSMLRTVAYNSAEVREAGNTRHKIKAINELRRLTRCSLMMAKTIIEEVYYPNNTRMPLN